MPHSSGNSHPAFHAYPVIMALLSRHFPYCRGRYDLPYRRLHMFSVCEKSLSVEVNVSVYRYLQLLMANRDTTTGPLARVCHGGEQQAGQCHYHPIGLCHEFGT